MIRAVTAGDADIAAAARALAARVPGPLGPLAELAYNYRWSWTPGGDELYAAIDADRWKRCAHNPVRLLEEAPYEALQRAAGDDLLLARVAEVKRIVDEELHRAPEGPVDPSRPVAFFCAEYAVHGSLPVYSGGLGVLAGDFLKEASDRALPVVGVGLMYGQGYFRQRVDGSGWQHEYWVETDPERVPAAVVTAGDGRPLTISMPIAGEDVAARIWRVDVGRVPLYLLDSQVPENSGASRWITARLYTGDPLVRLAQYALLGAGGMRVLQAMGIDPSVIHLNEGHAALAPVELAARDHGLDSARGRTVFTTHTPVPAGNDTYPADEVTQVLGTDGDLIGLGRTNPGEDFEPFGVTQLALRVSRAANAVSRRHGEVAREMWHALWPERAVGDVPITHVTNGVHLPTWVGEPMRDLYDRHLGADWPGRAADPATWRAVDGVADAELWSARARQRATLVAHVRERSVAERLARGDLRGYVDAAAWAFDPDALTVGFARRIATYKRLELLMRDADRALRLLGNDERPVQLVMAGKAHPRDEEAKRSLQHLFTMKWAREVSERVVYLDDYDLVTAKLLVQGCDVWLNVPRPPLEASGTSGMKSAVNGGLQLSVLDGWWPEAYDGTNGWALSGDVDADREAQDARDAAELLRLLEEEVVPAFYDRRDGEGVPRDWLVRMRASLRTIPPKFCAARMLDDYVRRIYVPEREDAAA
jgi:starch phosphorylase